MSAQDEDWGPWVEHDGLPRPELMGVFAHVYCANGDEGQGVLRNVIPFHDPNMYSRFLWDTLKRHRDSKYLFHQRIIRYRIRAPRGAAILNQLLQDLPAPVREMEGA